MASLNAKNFEKQFNEYLSKLIYAVFDDIARDWNGSIKHNPLIFQNYTNLLLDKKDRGEGLKSRFTIYSEVRQYLTLMFGKFVEEFKNIQMVDGDTVQSVIEKLNEANAECFSAFMFELGNRYKSKFGATLRSAGDQQRWFHSQIVGFLPEYATRHVLIGMVSDEFDTFLKAVAWIFGKLIWYYEVSVNSELFLGTLAQQDMEQVMLDELSSGLRAKVPAKPRKAKTDAKTKGKEAADASPEPTEVKKEEPVAPAIIPDIDDDVANLINDI